MFSDTFEVVWWVAAIAVWAGFLALLAWPLAAVMFWLFEPPAPKRSPSKNSPVRKGRGS